MNLTDLKKSWDQFGNDEHFWVIPSIPKIKENNWDEEDIFLNT